MGKTYKYDKGRMVECKKVQSRNDYDIENKGTMAEKIRHGYYQLEQNQGSRFQSGYSKNTLKRVYDTALAEGR